MKTSEQTDKLTAALVKAQTAIVPPTKDKTAKIGAYQYNYADLAAIIDASRKPLADNGLAITSTTEANGHVILSSRLMHVSGQWIEATYPLPADCTPQQMGSAITYGRRYTLCALLGIVAEDDDDGAAASGPRATGNGATVPTPAKKVYTLPPKVEDTDKVPASVTDAAAPAEINDQQGEAEGLEAVVLKAYSKEKKDKKGNSNRGVLLVMADNTEEWWNCYDAPTIAALPGLKGQPLHAKLEDKNGFKLCHKLEVMGG